ncbi:PilX N-terminal domain-containing pilus assembly protein [uncultured Microbulbifer sp.]|uniref:pilus assembly PilX family protein n=1 Tax=uncultured Microbulbifer sp. TaxID=348147 RepID=UPI0026188C23|nr:PilX N-terminal domain-containing pilus assembly protein [uncultured Microbulbifer sp.]
MQQQRGATLIVGLIMVLLMTIVGMAAIRGSSMQELMAGNLRDRNLAFQAAEAGLRQGESILSSLTPPVFDNDVSDGYTTEMDGSTQSGFWDTYTWASGSQQQDIGLLWVSQQPQFVIEEVTTSSAVVSEGGAIDFETSLKTEERTFYRVTSHGFGGTDTSEVILQSTYKK